MTKVRHGLENFPYRKAMVTGGAGFIGSHLVESLLDRGVEVVSIDNYLSGKPENLRHLKRHEGLHEVRCDVTDYDALKRFFPGVDVVFHNAASKKTVCLKDPRRDLAINAEGTFNVLELARDFGVQKVVHASTGSVYGEAQYFPQDEAHPLNPSSYYGVSKLAAERYALLFAGLYGMNTTVLRYFHVYGPRQESADERGGVVAIFSRRILAGLPPVIYGDGTQQRSFTFVQDVVRANLFVAGDPRTRGEAYNCASGINVTVGELAEEVLRACGRDDLRPEYGDWTTGDVKVFNVSNQKLVDLGFRFETRFEHGLPLTMAWYRDELSRGERLLRETGAE